MALPPLLGHAFPAHGLEATALPVFEALQAVLDRDVAPLATAHDAAHDAAGRYTTNARTLSLHDPVEWKYAEIGRHVLTGWTPPPGLYQ